MTNHHHHRMGHMQEKLPSTVIPTWSFNMLVSLFQTFVVQNHAPNIEHHAPLLSPQRPQTCGMGGYRRSRVNDKQWTEGHDPVKQHYPVKKMSKWSYVMYPVLTIKWAGGPHKSHWATIPEKGQPTQTNMHTQWATGAKGKMATVHVQQSVIDFCIWFGGSISSRYGHRHAPEAPVAGRICKLNCKALGIWLSLAN